MYDNKYIKKFIIFPINVILEIDSQLVQCIVMLESNDFVMHCILANDIGVPLRQELPMRSSSGEDSFGSTDTPFGSNDASTASSDAAFGTSQTASFDDESTPGDHTHTTNNSNKATWWCPKHVSIIHASTNYGSEGGEANEVAASATLHHPSTSTNCDSKGGKTDEVASSAALHRLVMPNQEHIIEMFGP